MTLQNFSPTVLLLDESIDESYSVKSWLETRGYNVRETNDVYDALEEMTDMTLEVRPSMILLNSYLSIQDSSWVMNSLQEIARERDVPIVSLRTNDNSEILAEMDEQFVQVDSFDSLKPLMQTLLPIYAKAQTAA